MSDIPKKIQPGLAYGGALVSFLCLFLVLMSNASSPDQQILGTWQEVSWEYEKVDREGYEPLQPGAAITDTMRGLIARDRIIHKAETWQFRPDGTLFLSGKPEQGRAAQWALKGRGHVLFMHYNQRNEESYDITKLTQDELILNFHTDMQVRGIAKITFKKIR